MHFWIPGLIFLAAAAVSNAEGAPRPECDGLADGSTLQESCLLKGDLKGLDSELDATFEKLLDQWKSMEFSLERTELIGAQRAWILYREKTCSFEQSVHGGTLSISFLRCMSRVTKERVDYLKELLYRGAGMLGSAHAVERTLSGRVRLPTGSAHAGHQALDTSASG